MTPSRAPLVIPPHDERPPGQFILDNVAKEPRSSGLRHASELSQSILVPQNPRNRHARASDETIGGIRQPRILDVRVENLSPDVTGEVSCEAHRWCRNKLNFGLAALNNDARIPLDQI